MPITVRPMSQELAGALIGQIERRVVFADNGCVELSGSPDGHGYSRVWTWVDGKAVMYRAHRVVWAYHNGDVLNGVLILHKCDNRKCVNKDHLFDGTPKINTHDAMKKGRFADGEKHGCAKLTEAQAAEAKTRYSHGGISFKKLGEEYGVSESQMNAIYLGRKWKCLNEK